MKVLFIGEYPVAEGCAVSGVQAVSRVMGEALSKQPDVELSVIAYQPGAQDGKTVRCDGYTLHHVAASPEGNLLTQGRADRRRLLRTLKEIAPDIIHANQTGVHALAAFDSGLPTVLTVHGIYYWLGKALYGSGMKGLARRMLFNRIHKESLRRARHVILISPYVWEAVGRLSKAKTYGIDNPIHPIYFEQRPAPEDDRLLFIGLISRRKGVDCLLEAFRIVSETHPDIRLDIVGRIADQEFHQSLLAYIRGNGLEERISWLGTMDSASLAARYASAVMLVLPSLEESAPGVIAEAMAVGCPVVATRVGGVPYMVDELRTGFLVEPRDPRGLAAAIMKILEDKVLREAMVTQAKQTALERFAPWTVAAKTTQVYRQVIEAEMRQ